MPSPAVPRCGAAALGTRGLVRERLIHPQHPTPPAVLAHSGHSALARRRPQSNGPGRRRCRGSAPTSSLRVSPCSWRAMTGVPAAAGDEPCRQWEAGKEEERAQARPLRRAARKTAAAERAGGAPGGTCAPSTRLPRRSRPPAPSIGPKGREREQSGRAHAALKLAGADPGVPGGLTPPPRLGSARLPPPLHSALLRPDLRLPPRCPWRCPCTLVRLPAAPHVTWPPAGLGCLRSDPTRG